jgi:hypothetical protein
MTTILDPGSNTLNPFTTVFTSVCTGSSSNTTVDDAVAHIVAIVTATRYPHTKLYELWDALFTSVVTYSESHSTLLVTFNTLAAHPPTHIRLSYTAKNRLSTYLQSDGKLCWSLLPRYHDLWRDTHDILEASRDWDGVLTSNTQNLSCPVAARFLRFCEYSAAALKAAKHDRGQNSLSLWVFYACRNVLECKEPKLRQTKPHRLSAEQSWALDVRVAAIWLRAGARALWETDADFLREHWTLALDEETQSWPCNEGLTKQRWRLWEDRMRALAADGKRIRESTTTVMLEAADVVKELLQSDKTLTSQW